MRPNHHLAAALILLLLLKLDVFIGSPAPTWSLCVSCVLIVSNAIAWAALQSDNQERR